MSQKNQKGLVVVVLIFSSIFAGPFTYRVYTFLQAYNKDNFDQIDFSISSVGDEAKAEMFIVANEKGENLNFSSEYYRYQTRYSTFNILEINIPRGVKLQDATGKKYLFNKIKDEYSFQQKSSHIEKNGKCKCDVQRFLFRSTHKYQQTDSVVRVLIKEDQTGKAILSDTLWRYGKISEQRTGVSTSRNSMINDEKTFKKQSIYKPKLNLCTINNQTPLIGNFKVVNISPLELECTEVISLYSIEERKENVVSKWFSGFDLVLWIVFVILLCVSLFFIITLIKRLIKGEPIQ